MYKPLIPLIICFALSCSNKDPVDPNAVNGLFKIDKIELELKNDRIVSIEQDYDENATIILEDNAHKSSKIIIRFPLSVGHALSYLRRYEFDPDWEDMTCKLTSISDSYLLGNHYETQRGLIGIFNIILLE